jgi:hypothetical protein
LSRARGENQENDKALLRPRESVGGRFASCVERDDQDGAKSMNAHVLASRQAPDAAIPRDFAILCLWSTFGIVLSGLLFIAGLGTEITEAFAAVG